MNAMKMIVIIALLPLILITLVCAYNRVREIINILDDIKRDLDNLK